MSVWTLNQANDQEGKLTLRPESSPLFTRRKTDQ